MHTYDDHCEITWENIWDEFDHYYLIHWIDWLLACFVLRNAVYCHLWSILDEFLELSWQHILPHFRECWWDHVFIDVLLSNTPAICIGLWLVKKFGLKQYDWLGTEGAKSWREWKVWTW